MKTKYGLLFGFVLLLAAMFTLAGCNDLFSAFRGDDNDNDGGSGDSVLTGMVSIIGIPAAGQTLIADPSGLSGSGFISYQWKANGAAIGTNAQTYTLTTGEVGKMITVTVTRAGYIGILTSAAIGPVTGDNSGGNVLGGIVSITGNPVVGQTLTAYTGGLGGTGAISYQWKANGAAIGTNAQTYTLTAAETGKTITVTVTRDGYTGSQTSAPTDSVLSNTGAALSGMVSITGTPAVGQTLTAYTSLNGSGIISYQWKANGAAIGTNLQTYTLTAAEAGKTITVTVRQSDRIGSLTSEPTEAVTGGGGTGGGDTGGTDNPFIGTWLWTGHKAVPDDSQPYTLEFTSVAYTFYDDNTYQGDVDMVINMGYYSTPYPYSVRGTYIYSGNTAVYTQQDQSINGGPWTSSPEPPRTATVSGNTLSISGETETWTKQQSIPGS